MITNKKTHIIFRSIFLAISLVGIIGSFGTYRGAYNPDFYLYFTNLSNYFCFGVILTLLIDDIKKFRAGVRNEASELAPNFRLAVCIMIIITFLVYNTILSHPFKVSYWTDFQSLIMHLVCPVMFILDYMLFSKHRTLRVYAPALTCIFPLIYVFYILIRAEVYVGTGKMVYPYFFLNGYEIGWGAVVLYIIGIAAIIIGLGYALWAYDKLVRNENGKLVWDFSSLPKPEPVDTQTEQVEEEKVEEMIDENKVVADEKEEKLEKVEESQVTEKLKRGRPKKKLEE